MTVYPRNCSLINHNHKNPVSGSASGEPWPKTLSIKRKKNFKGNVCTVDLATSGSCRGIRPGDSLKFLEEKYFCIFTFCTQYQCGRSGRELEISFNSKTARKSCKSAVSSLLISRSLQRWVVALSTFQPLWPSFTLNICFIFQVTGLCACCLLFSSSWNFLIVHPLTLALDVQLFQNFMFWKTWPHIYENNWTTESAKFVMTCIDPYLKSHWLSCCILHISVPTLYQIT